MARARKIQIRRQNDIAGRLRRRKRQISIIAAETDVDEIINAPIFQDGRSIAEAQTEIEL